MCPISGECFCGEFESGIPHGAGVFTYPNNDREDVNMDHGARHGKYDFNDIFKTDISPMDDILLVVHIRIFLYFIMQNILNIVLCLLVLIAEKSSTIHHNYYTDINVSTMKMMVLKLHYINILYNLYVYYFEVNNLFIRIRRRHCALF